MVGMLKSVKIKKSFSFTFIVKITLLGSGYGLISKGHNFMSILVQNAKKISYISLIHCCSFVELLLVEPFLLYFDVISFLPNLKQKTFES